MATKCVTGLVRFSYVNIFRSRAFREGQDAKYSICLLIPKKDKAGIAKIRAAIEEAVQEGIASKWVGRSRRISACLFVMATRRERTKLRSTRGCSL